MLITSILHNEKVHRELIQSYFDFDVSYSKFIFIKYLIFYYKKKLNRGKSLETQILFHTLICFSLLFQTWKILQSNSILFQTPQNPETDTDRVITFRDACTSSVSGETGFRSSGLISFSSTLKRKKMNPNRAGPSPLHRPRIPVIMPWTAPEHNTHKPSVLQYHGIYALHYRKYILQKIMEKIFVCMTGNQICICFVGHK